VSQWRWEGCRFASRRDEFSIGSVSWKRWIGLPNIAEFRVEGATVKAAAMPPHSKMIERLQYAVAWTFVKVLGALPRPLARWIAGTATRLLLLLLPKLQKTAEFNLELAFPEWTEHQRRAVMKRMTRNLGWMAAEFARMPRYTKKNIQNVVVLDGHENFLAGQSRGKGVLYLTGHIGAWELSSYAHALYGFPLHYMARPLDNKPLDALVNEYRGLSGNKPIYKNEAARVMLRVLKDAGTVGILADQNTMPEEGVFVDFFGVPACTTSGLARVALHTDAAVVPGYAFWDENLRKYRLRFEPPVELVRTGDTERDVLENTQRFAKVIEGIIRKYPEQWVWIHARWKNRPKGEAALYPFLS
jgi:Kdo2-lipid IVA lauroyltransferase/acyltransferase